MRRQQAHQLALEEFEYMRIKFKNNGSVFLMTIFAIAFLAVLVSGMLQITTEEIQLMRNHIYSAQALAVAEAGLNAAFAQIREGNGCDVDFEFGDVEDGLGDISFAEGSYSIQTYDYAGSGSSSLIIVSEGTSSQGFVARVQADVSISSSCPYVIRIDNYRINEQVSGFAVNPI
jgi:hypothetical protein